MKWHFLKKNTQNVFPQYSDSFVHLLSIKLTSITILNHCYSLIKYASFK